MEGEPGSTRLASHQEEIKEAREGSRRLKNEEKNDTLSKSPKGWMKGELRKPKLQELQKLHLM